MSTPTDEPRPVGPSASALALRAVVPGCALALVAAGLVIGSGRLPDGVGPYVAAGAGAAAVTGGLGAALKARAVARQAVAPHATQQLQIALLGDFVIQLFTIGLAMLGMFLAGVKFDFLVGFALAFATVAVGHQFGSSLVLARTLRRRAAHGAAAAAPTTTGDRDDVDVAVAPAGTQVSGSCGSPRR